MLWNLVVLLVFAGIVGWVIWYWYRASKDVVSQVEVLNPGGERGTALLVYIAVDGALW
jgi:hypothetical protein